MFSTAGALPELGSSKSSVITPDWKGVAFRPRAAVWLPFIGTRYLCKAHLKHNDKALKITPKLSRSKKVA